MNSRNLVGEKQGQRPGNVLLQGGLFSQGGASFFAASKMEVVHMLKGCRAWENNGQLRLEVLEVMGLDLADEVLQGLRIPGSIREW
jgi:hypothetical protein